MRHGSPHKTQRASGRRITWTWRTQTAWSGVEWHHRGGERVTFKGKVHRTGLPMESGCQSHSPHQRCSLCAPWGAKVKFEDKAQAKMAGSSRWTFWLDDLLICWAVKVKRNYFKEGKAKTPSICQCYIKFEVYFRLTLCTISICLEHWFECCGVL